MRDELYSFLLNIQGKQDFFNLLSKQSDDEDYVKGFDEAQAKWQRRFAQHTLGEQQ